MLRAILIAGGFLFVMLATKSKAAPKTIAERLAEFGEPVRGRLEPKFRAAGVSYPPKRVTLIGIKQDRTLEVHAAGADNLMRYICTYPVLAASGTLGPKLREGDRQVPEGIYRVESLNPNSRFHLSLKLDYPNAFDRAKGLAEKRTRLGGLIMIHGEAVSIGCLAMGNPAAEDLFVLAARTGIENLTVILAPVDFRHESLAELPTGSPVWTQQLYQQIKRELLRYPRRDLLHDEEAR